MLLAYFFKRKGKCTRCKTYEDMTDVGKYFKYMMGRRYLKTVDLIIREM